MKDGNIQSFGAVETKLMYTLHWIILDAAEECADSDFEKGIFHSSPFYYLFPIPTITVYFFLSCLKNNMCFLSSFSCIYSPRFVII